MLVARPGADPALTTAALDALRDETRVRVVGAELAWQEGWREPRRSTRSPSPSRCHAATTTRSPSPTCTPRSREGRRVVAKFRTGPTPTWPWPDEAELAAFLGICAGLGVPFKLTGGLHHAGRGTYEVAGMPEENHGVLNVLVATSAAFAGAGQDEVAALLAVHDAVALADLVAAWPDATGARVREGVHRLRVLHRHRPRRRARRPRPSHAPLNHPSDPTHRRPTEGPP